MIPKNEMADSAEVLGMEWSRFRPLVASLMPHLINFAPLEAVHVFEASVNRFESTVITVLSHEKEVFSWFRHLNWILQYLTSLTLEIFAECNKESPGLQKSSPGSPNSQQLRRLKKSLIVYVGRADQAFCSQGSDRDVRRHHYHPSFRSLQPKARPPALGVPAIER